MLRKKDLEVETIRKNDYAETIGGGHKQRYRIIDFKRDKNGIPATVKTIEYDPNRTAFIALVSYTDGEKRYVIAQNGFKGRSDYCIWFWFSTRNRKYDAVKRYSFGNNNILYRVTSRSRSAVMARSAGSFAQLMARDGKYATVKLPSGETRLILLTCTATIGVVSNSDHQLLVSGKAGRSRWLGKRPRTRAVVMNPVDHPMGGGEGKSSGGHPRSRNGIPAKGYKTRSKTKASNKYILERRKK